MSATFYVATPPRKKATTDMSYIKGANFGDELNFLLFQNLFANYFDSWYPANRHAVSELEYGTKLVTGIGSILNEHLPEIRQILVWGSGIGYGLPPKRNILKVLFARGPISNMILGLDANYESCDAAYALCLSKIELPRPLERDLHLIVPHYTNTIVNLFFDSPTQLLYKLGDYAILNPLGDPLMLLSLIQSAKTVTAEAMHGAIMADVFRVPWRAALLGINVNEMKWHDWLLAFKSTYRPHTILPLQGERSLFFRALARTAKITQWPLGISDRLSSEIVSKMDYICKEDTTNLTETKIVERKFDFLSTSAQKLRKLLSSP